MAVRMTSKINLAIGGALYMKIILSRKGFDSAFGGCASPIFPDGTIISLPILHRFKSPPPPSPPRLVTFSHLRGTPRLDAVVRDLTRHRGRPVTASDPVHLDPDLRLESLLRGPGWRPLFGQADQAQRHLENQGVASGDIFLFFGWFRRVEHRNGRYQFVRGAPDLHVVYGWLEVGDVWLVGRGEQDVPDWAVMHPHLNGNYGASNAIYVPASDESGYRAGAFERIADELILTAPGSSRSHWRLPGWLHPSSGKPALTYHEDRRRWSVKEGHAYLRSASPGQEFVLDTEHYPEAEGWARRLMKGNSRRKGATAAVDR
jgi:hypothetical protein